MKPSLMDSGWSPTSAPTAERQAAGGIPITQFGEDSLGVWFTAKPGTIMHLEALPWGITFGSHLLHRISPASMERVNISVLKQIKNGKQILAEAGSVQALQCSCPRQNTRNILKHSSFSFFSTQGVNHGYDNKRNPRI